MAVIFPPGNGKFPGGYVKTETIVIVSFFCEKSFLRWCIAGNLLANQRTFSQSCTFSTLLLIRLDLSATLPHTASTG